MTEADNNRVPAVGAPRTAGHHPYQIDVVAIGRKYGVDVVKIIASANENAAATKAARTKPPKNSKAKK
jgi:hypothetical protein